MRGGRGFYILGGQGALNNLTAVWYDTEVRGTAVGTMQAFGRLGGTLGPYVTGWLQQLAPGSSILFIAISMAALIGACMILLASPRQTSTVTRRRTLRVTPHGSQVCKELVVSFFGETSL